jgi:hypothetical protein
MAVIPAREIYPRLCERSGADSAKKASAQVFTRK